MNEHFLTEIEIKQFKCFTDFKASGFKRVNLIGGKNNIGKTALMEYIYVNFFNQDKQKTIEALTIIRINRESANFDKNEIKISHQSLVGMKSDFDNINYKIEVSKEFSNLALNISKNIKFIGNFGCSDSVLINYYEGIKNKEELNNLIREFDDSIENFKVTDDKPQCKTNGEYRNITEFGDGLKHYISIICSLYLCKNGYLFIDEIDNGIYYEHFDRLWEIILTLSKQTNCQVFATTHSKEMLESFARVAKKLDEQDISYTRLVKNKKQELKSITFDYAVIEYSFENSHEVR